MDFMHHFKLLAKYRKRRRSNKHSKVVFKSTRLWFNLTHSIDQIKKNCAVFSYNRLIHWRFCVCVIFPTQLKSLSYNAHHNYFQLKNQHDFLCTQNRRLSPKPSTAPHSTGTPLIAFELMSTNQNESTFSAWI